MARSDKGRYKKVAAIDVDFPTQIGFVFTSRANEFICEVKKESLKL